MLEHGRIHQGHVREIRDFSTCTSQHVGAARRWIWRDVTLPWQRPRYERSWFMAWRHVAFKRYKQTYPLQICYEHNMLPLLRAVCLKLLVFFLLLLPQNRIPTSQASATDSGVSRYNFTVGFLLKFYFPLLNTHNHLPCLDNYVWLGTLS